MTTRIRILPYGPSDSCNALKEAIRTYLSDNRINASVQNLRSEGSIFTARPSDIIINYGNRRYPQSFFGNANVLNNLESLNRAANKLTALGVMREAGIETVEYTTDLAVAMGWHQNSIVYARSTLTGHSGEGITVHVPQDNSVIQANQPLYTKGIQGARREWRVHVFKGIITYVQKKIRRNGYREDPNYREDVRNHHTGWVYSNQFNDTPNDAVLWNAVKAVEALSLDFGAVDVISRGTNAWVLEVNTAPGLTGTTLGTYQHNIVEYVKEISGQTPAYRVAYALPDYQVAINETVEIGEDEEALIAEPEAPSTISMPQTQMEETETVPQTSGAYPRGIEGRGLYMINTLHPASNQRMATNVLGYFCGRHMYRHGWNNPINRGDYEVVGKLETVTLTNGTVVNV